MTRAQRLWAWLENNPHAKPRAMREALNLTYPQLRAALYEMVRTGLVLSHGVNGSRTYTVGRKPRAYGQPKPEQKTAERIAKVRQTEYAAQDRRDAARQIVAMRSDSLAATPVREEWPCTETFMRDNPEKVMRLEPGRWSTPLRIDL